MSLRQHHRWPPCQVPRPCQALSSLGAVMAAVSSAWNVLPWSLGFGCHLPATNPRLSVTTAAPTFPPSSRPSLWLSIYFCDCPLRPSLPLARKLSRDLDLRCVTHCHHPGSQAGAWPTAQCVFVEVGGQEMRLRAGRGAESFENQKSWLRAPVPSLVLLGKRSRAH